MKRFRNPKHNQESGFTLLEILCALVISCISAVSIAQAFVTHLNFNTNSERRANAVFAVENALDNLRSGDITSLPTSGTTTTSTMINGSLFDVVTKYCSDTNYCKEDTMRSLHIEAHYINRAKREKNKNYKGIKLYEVNTVFVQLD